MEEFKVAHKKWLAREKEKGYKEADLVPSLSFFLKNKDKFNQRDIFKWDGKELEDFIKENQLVSNRQLRNENRGSFVKIIETDRFLVVRPDDKEAAAYWGKGTKWCITMLESGHFDEYRGQNVVFYYLIDKTAENQDNYSKVAIVMNRNEKNITYKKDIDYYLADDTCVRFAKLPKDIRDFLEPPSKKKVTSDKKSN